MRALVPSAAIPPGATWIVDPHPKVPVTGGAIQAGEVARLLKRVPREQQEAYRFLVQEIQHGYVTFPEFRKALEEGAADFVASNANVVRENRFVAYTFGSTGSNPWCTELLMERKKELGLPAHLVSFGNSDDLLRSLPKSGIRDILVVDDGSYSGSQLRGILSSLDRGNQQLIRGLAGQDLNVHIVIPYLSDVAREATQTAHPGLNVKVYEHQRIPSFRERVDLAVSEKRISPAVAKQVETLLVVDHRSLLFFDHKIPDVMSTVSFRHQFDDWLQFHSPLETMIVPKSLGQPPQYEITPPIVRPILPPYRR